MLFFSSSTVALVVPGRVPGSDEALSIAAAGVAQQDRLWVLAQQALVADPQGNASLLYVQALDTCSASR